MICPIVHAPRHATTYTVVDMLSKVYPPQEEGKNVRVADGKGGETLVHGSVLRLRIPMLATLPSFDVVILVTGC